MARAPFAQAKHGHQGRPGGLTMKAGAAHTTLLSGVPALGVQGDGLLRARPAVSRLGEALAEGRAAIPQPQLREPGTWAQGGLGQQDGVRGGIIAAGLVVTQAHAVLMKLLEPCMLALGLPALRGVGF